ncbi:MAG: ferritin-like domain-containing protein [Polyangiaceae bacterium]
MPDPKKTKAKNEKRAEPERSSEARPEPTDAVRLEWGRRIHAEYRSAAITHKLTLWLIQAAVSPDLIHMGLRIVKDELAHARLSHRVFVAAGGRTLDPLARETLDLSAVGDSLELDIARCGVEVFCLGETVAVPLFKRLREDCSVKQARAALDRILVDEVRHRDFGWTLLAYLLEQPFGPAVRKLVERELPGMFERLAVNYAGSTRAPAKPAPTVRANPAERAWGLMPSAWYAAALDRTFERDYRPRFEALGIDARRAWPRA